MEDGRAASDSRAGLVESTGEGNAPAGLLSGDAGVGVDAALGVAVGVGDKAELVMGDTVGVDSGDATGGDGPNRGNEAGARAGAGAGAVVLAHALLCCGQERVQAPLVTAS